jgi:histidine triad (HIT) family protein
MDCIFCKIIEKEIPAEIVFEDEEILAFKDTQPIAPVHILIIPKRHIESVNQFENVDANLAGRMILVAKQIAVKLDIAEKGYKLLFRVGRHGGQEVPHMHLHLIGGAKMIEDIYSIE